MNDRAGDQSLMSAPRRARTRQYTVVSELSKADWLRSK